MPALSTNLVVKVEPSLLMNVTVTCSTNLAYNVKSASTNVDSLNLLFLAESVYQPSNL